ncbi:MAG: FimV/HubP family polar landmark protein [Thiobacillaceae bacterium]
MKLKRFTTQLMAAGLIALPLMTHAAGLGKLSVTSALGQPLAAEIELLAADKAELDSLAASLASDQAFRDARIEYSPVLSMLQFAVEKRANGKAVLKVTSSRPVNDPFIDMLVELNWASGRMVREYTVLLDPPGAAAPQTVAPVVIAPAQTAPAVSAGKPRAAPEPAPAVAKSAAPAVTKSKKPKSEPKPEPKETVAAEPTPEKTQPSSSVTDTVRVKHGDTLAGIARQVRPEGIGLEQALVGLYRENADAFDGKNINRLKTGKTLKVPSAEALAAIDSKEARREIKLQTDDWQAYRQKLADAVRGAPELTVKAQPGQSASGKITSKVEDKAKPAVEATKDVLKLSKVTPPAPNASTANKAAEAQAMKDKLRAQEEDATAREKALNESSSRVSALEKQVTDMQALVKMKEEAAKQAKASAEAAAKAEAAKPVPTPVAPVTAPVAEPEPTAAWYAPLLNNPLYWAAGAVTVGLGGLLWWMMSGGRRRKSAPLFEDSIMSGGDISPNTVVGAASGGSINTGDTSFLTDFSQAGLGTIDTHDVDPIAEAEVYMAYGRDAQAEEILKEAIIKNPDRHEVRMKLLEIYAARRNPEAYQAVASDLFAALGNKSGGLWDKAAEMGRSIDPTNPLYGGVQASVPAVQEQIVETVAATAAIGGGAMAFDTLAGDSAIASEAASAGLEFESAGHVLNFDATPAVQAAPVEASTNELDFDLSSLDIPEATHDDLDLGLSLDDDNGPDSKFDFSGLDLDLGDAGAGDAELDEVGTKLDLARAYVEMGDKEGAREILNEVIVEGNDKQKADAKGMLGSLA